MADVIVVEHIKDKDNVGDDDVSLGSAPQVTFACSDFVAHGNRHVEPQPKDFD